MPVLPPPGCSLSIEKLQAYGVTDPQVRIYDDRAYLYASHDIDPDSTRFVMPDWQLWSSDDLVNWSYETTLDPRQTYIAKPFDGCWAGDSICKNGTYYWCFSAVDQTTGLHEIGLVSSPTPTGPWSDPIGGPWIRSDAAATEVYDPGFLQLENGDVYLVFGVWDYYIARLADDMSGLAETPRKIEIANPHGPYGKGKTDDKPFLHQRGNLFYLSWGCFYAIALSPYGPYEYRGCLVEEDKMDPPFREKTWPHGPQQGRHGSFFDWRGQSYFMYCDMSFSGNRYYRGSWISYVHYRENGEIAPIEITADAVGRYTADHRIPAENFSSATSIQKTENSDGSFSIQPLEDGAWVSYPKIRGLKSDSAVVTLAFSKTSDFQSVQIASGTNPPGDRIPIKNTVIQQRIETFDPKAGITVYFQGDLDPELRLDTITIAGS